MPDDVAAEAPARIKVTVLRAVHVQPHEVLRPGKIAEAVFARCLSAQKDERVAASKILKGPAVQQAADALGGLDLLVVAIGVAAFGPGDTEDEAVVVAEPLGRGEKASYVEV